DFTMIDFALISLIFIMSTPFQIYYIKLLKNKHEVLKILFFEK
ncbi:unnamed protein product, partial [marine sediment metagenome]